MLGSALLLAAMITAFLGVRVARRA
jgi:hypothetical protein